MTKNMNANNENLKNNIGQSKLPDWKKCHHGLDEMNTPMMKENTSESAPPKYRDWRYVSPRQWLFVRGSLAWALMMFTFAWVLTLFPHRPLPWVCWLSILLSAAFIAGWAWHCRKTNKISLNGRKISLFKLGSWWLLSVWLSLFVSVAIPVSAQSATNQVPAGIQQAHLTDQPATTQDQNKPAESQGCILGWILVITAVVIILAAVYAVCVAAGLCPPLRGTANIPQSPSVASGVKSAVSLPNVNPNVALPATVYYVQNGVIVSNSAGIASSTLPSLISLGGQPVASGTEIDMGQIGLTTPPSIMFWQVTNAVSDATLDSTHNYILCFNYSLVTATNLTAGWQEVSTTVGYLNNNTSVPLICTITYTNGIAETTNWLQVFGGKNPTNFVIYGTLPAAPPGTTPAVAKNKVTSADNDSFPPGPGGTVIAKDVHFYKMTANTNAVQTSWP
jgi:hypothetical protein